MSLKPTTKATIEPRETTDVEDVRLLADEIKLLCQTPAYDDMTWAEIDNAFRLASHELKINFTATGTVMPAPVEPPVVLSSRR